MKQGKPSLAYLIHDVARLQKRRFAESARRHGLTLPQWRVIAQLEHEGELSQIAIANLIESDPMTVSRMLERMEATGLVERVPDPSDSRAKLVRLTDSAHALYGAMRKVGEKVYDEALRGVSSNQRTALMAALERMRSNLQTECAGKDKSE